MIDKVSYEEFINTFPSISSVDDETAKIWKARQKNSSFIDHMSDVWGEAKQCVELKEKGDIKALDAHIETLTSVINCVLTDSKLSNGAKEELREAEWELLDYCIWDNEWNSTPQSVMEWFNQWIFDYNYSLV